MSGLDNSLVGQLCQYAQALYYLHHAASVQVCSANRLLKEGVACECHVLLLAVECNRTFRVSWCRYDLQFMIAKSDVLVVGNDRTSLRQFKVQLHAVEFLCLLIVVVHHVPVAFGYFWLQSVVFENGIVAKRLDDGKQIKANGAEIRHFGNG